MRYITLGNTDMSVSVIALGTFAIGGWNWGGIEQKEAINAIKCSIDNGVNFIDTAPIYGNGLAEELVGRSLKGIRDKVIIATKCGLVFGTKKGEYFFDYETGRNVQKYLGPESIIKELEKSLSRLKTDYIDLYQTHWQDKTTPIADTMDILLKLKKQGKIKAIGVSNVNIEQLKEYVSNGTINSDQEMYSMLDREIEKEILPYCKQQNITILAYSPLSRGLLTGKIDGKYEFHGDDYRKTYPRFSLENRIKVKNFLNKIKYIAENHDVGFTQIAISWVLSKGKNIIALCGARNAEQVLDNLKAGDIILSSEEIDFIDEAVRKSDIE